MRISQRTKHRETGLLDFCKRWNIRQDGVVDGDDGCIDGWIVSGATISCEIPSILLWGKKTLQFCDRYDVINEGRC